MELEGTIKGHLLQLPCSEQGHPQLGQVAQSLALDVSRSGDSSTSLGNSLDWGCQSSQLRLLVVGSCLLVVVGANSSVPLNRWVDNVQMGQRDLPVSSHHLLPRTLR